MDKPVVVPNAPEVKKPRVSNPLFMAYAESLQKAYGESRRAWREGNPERSYATKVMEQEGAV